MSNAYGGDEYDTKYAKHASEKTAGAWGASPNSQTAAFTKEMYLRSILVGSTLYLQRSSTSLLSAVIDTIDEVHFDVGGVSDE